MRNYRSVRDYVVLTLFAFGTLLVGSSRLQAVNRLFIDNAEIKAGADGLEVLVKCDNDMQLYAISLSIQFDPALLEVVQIEPSGVAASVEWEAGFDLNQVNNAVGHIIYGFLTEFDFGGSPNDDNVIPVGTNQTVAKITLNTSDVGRTSTSLEFVDGLGDGEFGAINSVVNGQGVTFRSGSVNSLILSDGLLTIDPLEPVVQLIENGTGPAGSVFQVIGRHFDQPGLDVRVCEVAADFSLRPDGQTLDVTAPSCVSCASGVCCVDLEVINENGSDTVGEGFCYDVGRPFVRADANNDTDVDISDAISILGFQFLGNEVPAPCRDALDSDDNGVLDVTDSVFLLSFLFLGTVDIPPPYPQPGLDPTPDTLPGC